MFCLLSLLLQLHRFVNLVIIKDPKSAFLHATKIFQILKHKQIPKIGRKYKIAITIHVCTRNDYQHRNLIPTLYPNATAEGFVYSYLLPTVEVHRHHYKFHHLVGKYKTVVDLALSFLDSWT